jgi:hypothetical protein
MNPGKAVEEAEGKKEEGQKGKERRRKRAKAITLR